MFVFWLSAKAWIDASRGVLILTNDQIAIGTALTKDLDPSLFVRDYVYHDLSLWAFYTPFMLWLAKALWRVLGSYDLAIAALVPLVLAVYVVGMYRLVLAVSGDRLVSLVVALVSTAPRYSIGYEVWGVSGADGIGPRALFWAASPYLFWIMFRLRARGWNAGLLVGLTLGVMANLHPVSALPAGEVLTVLALITAPSWKSALGEVVGLGVGALLGGLPTVLTFVRGLRGVVGLPPISFEEFAQLLRERLVTLFPHKPLRYPLVDVPISPAVQEAAVWMYVLFLVVMAVAAWRAGRSGGETSALWRLLVLGHVPLVFLVTGMPHGGFALVIVLAFYPLLWWLDDVDKWLVRLLVVVTSLSWLGSYGFVRLWEATQAWSLTTIMAEHARGARLIYVPLYLILACVSVRLLAREGRGLRGWSVVIASWATVFVTPDAPLPLLGVLATVWLAQRDDVRRLSWWPAMRDALVTGGLVWPVVYLISSGRRPYAIVGLAIGLTAASRWLGARRGWSQTWSTATALVLTAVLGAGIVAPVIAGRVVPLWKAVAPRSHATLWQEARDLIDLSAWAGRETPTDALFFFGPPTLGIASDAEFRFRARRAITHAWKDIGIAYYSRVRLVDFHERYYALEAARHEPARLAACTRALGTDYVILSPRERLELPVAYRNATYTVYRVSDRAPRPGDWTLPPECPRASLGRK
jgi:hypothetical protein